MQRKRIKFWMVFCTVISLISIAFLVLFFAFRVKRVEVDFVARLNQNQTMLSSDIKTYVKDSFVEEKNNKNIILMKFDDTVLKLEKEYPFLKIDNVIKGFPNIIKVYISERIPKYRVKISNNTFNILDEDFKVLKNVTEAELKNDELYCLSSYYDSTIEIYYDNITTIVEEGNFISNNDNIMNYCNEISSGIYGRTKDYFKVKSIKVINNETDYSFNIIMKNDANINDEGCKILIEGLENLKEKTFAGISTFEEEMKKSTSFNQPETIIKITYKNGVYEGLMFKE